ncbi:MAG: helix-turn-helix transcriptional regulator [Butyrivibrio crossotus]|nr:helix-turn-helix transcriptional regulator [Butyrivibrio crossotus]
MGLYEDLEKGLLEAIAMEKGDIPMVKKDNMPAPTYTAAEMERKLIDEIVQIRKEQNISQSQLAKLTGNKQQAISRTENKEHSPSLKLFYSMVHALGYDLKLVKAQ